MTTEPCQSGHDWSEWEEHECGCLPYIQHSYSHEGPDPNCERCRGSNTYWERTCRSCGEKEESSRPW